VTALKHAADELVSALACVLWRRHTGMDDVLHIVVFAACARVKREHAHASSISVAEPTRPSWLPGKGVSTSRHDPNTLEPWLLWTDNGRSL
jgi:hypothetical protein